MCSGLKENLLRAAMVTLLIHTQNHGENIYHVLHITVYIFAQDTRKIIAVTGVVNVTHAQCRQRILTFAYSCIHVSPNIKIEGDKAHFVLEIKILFLDTEVI